MSKLNRVQEFQLYCLESYRSKNNMSGIKALEEFKLFKVFEYLAVGYDVLHSQGGDYLIADIADYLKRRKRSCE